MKAILRFALVASVANFHVTGCAFKEVVHLSASDPIFQDALAPDNVYNWDESLAFFMGDDPGTELVMNFQGNLCQPKESPHFTKQYGAGVSGVPTHSGIFICGGENNIWGGPSDSKTGGECCFWNEYTTSCFTVKTVNDDSQRMGAGAKDDEYKGHLIMATDSNRIYQQKFIFAFAQDSGQVLYCILKKHDNDTESEPKMEWIWKGSEIQQLPNEDGPLPIPVKDPCIVVNNYFVYIIGGKDRHGKDIQGMWMTKFDLQDETEKKSSINYWAFVRGFPSQPRSGATCYADFLSNQLWVIGGTNNDQPLRDSEYIDLQELQAASTNPPDVTGKPGPKLAKALKHTFADQLFDDNGKFKRTFVIGMDGDKLCINELKDTGKKLLFRLVKTKYLYGDANNVPSLEGMTSSVFPGIKIPDCQQKVDFENVPEIILRPNRHQRQDVSSSSQEPPVTQVHVL